MIIRKDDLQKICTYVSKAIDTSSGSTLSASIGLEGKGNFLCAKVTNREYFVEAKVDVGEPVDFNATVDAQWFIKLVSKLTSNTVEMVVDGNSVSVSADGKYKIPLVFDDDEMLVIDEMSIESVDTEFELSEDVMSDILTFNVREMNKASATKPIQKMCYIDECGAVTFSGGACVNSFTLPDGIKLLLNETTVNLLKLFDTPTIHVSVGTDGGNALTSLTKITFENETITATAIIRSDEATLNSFPVAAIRGRAEKDYRYSIDIKRDYLVSCLDRLLLFSKFNGTKPLGTFEYDENKVTITGVDQSAKEFVYFDTTVNGVDYTSIFNIEELKATVDKCKDSIIKFSFGDNQATVVSHGNVKNVVPELRINQN